MSGTVLPMRYLLLLPALLLTGCIAVPPDAVTAPQEAQNAHREVAAAQAAVARSQASAVATIAQMHVTGNGGSTAGLAAELRSTEPALVAGAHSLTDTYVSFDLASGQCLYQPLPSGAPYTSAC